MVNNHCVSSYRDQETIIALRGQYDCHLEAVFVLQDGPLNLQSEDSFQNATIVNPDGEESFCYSQDSSR